MWNYILKKKKQKKQTNNCITAEVNHFVLTKMVSKQITWKSSNWQMPRPMLESAKAGALTIRIEQ